MVFNTGPYTVLPDNSILITANMQSETGFPSSHELKSYVAFKSRLKLAARAVLSADAGLLVLHSFALTGVHTSFPSPFVALLWSFPLSYFVFCRLLPSSSHFFPSPSLIPVHRDKIRQLECAHPIDYASSHLWLHFGFLQNNFLCFLLVFSD